MVWRIIKHDGKLLLFSCTLAGSTAGNTISFDSLAFFVHDYKAAMDNGCITEPVASMSPDKYINCYSILGKYCEQQQPGERCDFKNASVTFYDATKGPEMQVAVAKGLFGTGQMVLGAGQQLVNMTQFAGAGQQLVNKTRIVEAVAVGELGEVILNLHMWQDGSFHTCCWVQGCKFRFGTECPCCQASSNAALMAATRANMGYVSSWGRV